MAESLASYFERNSLRSGTFGVGGIQGDSGTASKKDCDSSKLEMIREDHSRTTMTRETGFTLGEKTYYQDVHGGSIISSCAPRFIRNLNENGLSENSGKDLRWGTDCWSENRRREVNTGERPQEIPSLGCSVYSNSSSFEFHVSSEEGINLSVDLNFNSSDWINSMRNEVHICNSIGPKKSRRVDEGSDCVTESKKHKSQAPFNVNPGRGKDDPAVEDSSASLPVKGNSEASCDHQPSDGGSLTSSAIEPCSIKRDISDKYKKDEGHNLCIPHLSAPNQIVLCAESCSNGCCMVSLDLDSVNSPREKIASDSVMAAAECAITLDTQDNLIGDLPNEILENPSRESPRTVG